MTNVDNKKYNKFPSLEKEEQIAFNINQKREVHTKKVEKTKKTIIDLFVGAGGLSEGFVLVGFVPVAHVEMDKDACYTLRTRCCYHYFRSHDKLDVYYSYLKGKISTEALYSSVPKEVVDTVINVEIPDDTISDTFKQIHSLAGEISIDMIKGR